MLLSPRLLAEKRRVDPLAVLSFLPGMFWRERGERAWPTVTSVGLGEGLHSMGRFVSFLRNIAIATRGETRQHFGLYWAAWEKIGLPTSRTTQPLSDGRSAK